MSFIAGFLVGIVVGAILGMGVLILAWSLATQDTERGESETEAAFGFFLMVALILLGLWALGGWELPL